MVGVFRDTLGQCQIAPYSKMIPTAITNLTATSTVAGQITLSWSGGLGSNVVYSYVLSSGTIQSVSGSASPVTLTLTSTNQITSTVTVTAILLGGSGSVVSNSVTTPIPISGWVIVNKATYYFPFISDYSNYVSGSAVSAGITAYNNPTFITNTNSKTSAIDSTCLYLNNTSSQYATSTSISMTVQSAISFAFWVKSNKTVTPYWGRLFTMECAGNTFELSFGISPVTNLMYIQRTGTAFITSVSSLNNNTWFFVVLVISGTSASLYINGSTTAEATGTLSASITGNNYTIFSFGNYPSVYPNDYSNVNINNFAIYNGYALSSSDITTLYNLGY